MVKISRHWAISVLLLHWILSVDKVFGLYLAFSKITHPCQSVLSKELLPLLFAKQLDSLNHKTSVATEFVCLPLRQLGNLQYVGKFAERPIEFHQQVGATSCIHRLIARVLPSSTSTGIYFGICSFGSVTMIRYNPMNMPIIPVTAFHPGGVKHGLGDTSELVTVTQFR